MINSGGKNFIKLIKYTHRLPITEEMRGYVKGTNSDIQNNNNAKWGGSG